MLLYLGSGAIEFDEFVLLMSRTPPATENIDREQSSLLFSVIITVLVQYSNKSNVKVSIALGF